MSLGCVIPSSYFSPQTSKRRKDYELRPLADFTSPIALCFGMVNHVTVGMMDRVSKTGSSKKRVSTQVNDARSKDLNDCKPGRKRGRHPFALTVKQRGKTIWFS